MREIHLNGKIEIVYCPTEEMVADIFTKPATKVKLNTFKVPVGVTVENHIFSIEASSI